MTPRGSTLAFSLLFAAILHAQTTPPPSGAFLPPITGYAGRYLDSAQTQDFQGGPGGRTLRAQLVKVAPERGLILMKISGSVFGVYGLSTFASRLSESLSTGGHGEKYLIPDVFKVDPEHSSEWTTFLIDGQDFLFDFDYDDRGYLYLAYSAWGFGIVDSTGMKVSQVLPGGFNPRPERILVVRSGANRFAIVSDASATTAVYDVTNAAAPLFLRTLPFGIASYAKVASGSVAVVTTSGFLRIYATGGDLAAGSAPAQTFMPSPGGFYTLVATDGITIFATRQSGGPSASLSVLTPTGGGYVETQYPPRPGFLSVDLHYGAGYVVLSGFTFPGPNNRTVLVYTAGSSTPSDLTSYFTAAYPPGRISVASMAPYASGRQTYLIAALFGVGDVFTMSGAQASAIPAFSPAMLIALAIGMAAIAAWRLR